MWADHEPQQAEGIQMVECCMCVGGWVGLVEGEAVDVYRIINVSLRLCRPIRLILGPIHSDKKTLY